MIPKLRPREPSRRRSLLTQAPLLEMERGGGRVVEGILGDLLDEREILASFDVNPIAEAVGCGFARDCSETIS